MNYYITTLNEYKSNEDEIEKQVKLVKEQYKGLTKQGHPTQVSNTIASYAKMLAEILKYAKDKSVEIADVGAGFGMFKNLANRLGFKNITSIEPNAELFDPDYKYTSDVPSNTYDFIVCNQVLNVLDKHIRDAVVEDIGRMLKPNGRAYISTRGNDVLGASTGFNPNNKKDLNKLLKDFPEYSRNDGVINPETMAIYIPKFDSKSQKNILQYQKGFTSQELKNYVSEILDGNYEINILNGIGKASIEIIKEGK